MEKFTSLSYSRYDCKYHVVFVPKFRKKSLIGKIRQYEGKNQNLGFRQNFYVFILSDNKCRVRNPTYA